jgi:hypothetical protein
MIIKSAPSSETAPAGKRTVRDNQWGNRNAYISGRFWKTLGPTYSVGIEEATADFLEGRDNA